MAAQQRSTVGRTAPVSLSRRPRVSIMESVPLVTLPVLSSYSSFPTDTRAHPLEKSCSCLLFFSIFRQIFNFQNDSRLRLRSYLHKKLNLRVSVLASFGGHGAWFSPPKSLSYFFFFLTRVLSLFLEVYILQKKVGRGKKTIQMIFSEFILCPVSRPPPPFWSLFSSLLCLCPLK